MEILKVFNPETCPAGVSKGKVSINFSRGGSIRLSNCLSQQLSLKHYDAVRFLQTSDGMFIQKHKQEFAVREKGKTGKAYVFNSSVLGNEMRKVLSNDNATTFMVSSAPVEIEGSDAYLILPYKEKPADAIKNAKKGIENEAKKWK